MGCVTKYDNHKITTLFSLCDCRTEILVMEYDHDLKICELAIFSSALYGSKMSFMQRIRYIFAVLLYGIPYKDQIIVSLKQLKEIKNFCDIAMDRV